MPEDGKGSPEKARVRRCFVVSAFGTSADEQKRHKQVLQHLVRRVLGDKFEVVRADEIDEEGLITNQIIEHLIDDDLVVADLTGLNPNVFYEVAVRHAARKPIVHLITQGQKIPFDVANMRAVQYALDDPDLLETARKDLARKVRAIEEGGWQAAPNPISVARDVGLLQKSEQPEIREAGDILAAVGEIRDELRILNRRTAVSEGSSLGGDSSLERALVADIEAHDPTEEGAVFARFVSFPRKDVYNALGKLLSEKKIYLVEGKLSLIPF